MTSWEDPLLGGRSDAVHPGGPKGPSPTWGEARGAATLGAPALLRNHPPVTHQTTVSPPYPCNGLYGPKGLESNKHQHSWQMAA